jgi:hypothetical protein
MALVVFDRVQETTATTGTGPITLTGAVAGFQSFAVIGNGNTTFYCIVNATNWEVGIGTYSTTGPTLSRTTILANYLGTTAAISLVGPSNVFVTYPAEKSVNLDGSGNVSPLGTITSGVWNGTTIPVAYGGTGVTASSGANSVVLRDGDQNIAVNRVNQSNTTTTAAGGTTALTAASSYIHTLVGTGGQTYTLPDATTIATGVAFLFNNIATGTLTIQDYATGPIGTIPSGGAGAVFLTNNATVGGTWDLHSYLPEGVTFGTNAFNLGSAVVSGGTWQGGTIQPAYGGTGLTTFVGANNALYSTGASTLTAGTLPITAGGTGQTTAADAFNALSPMTTTGDIIYEASSAVAARLPIGTSGQVLTVSGGIPEWGAISGASTLQNQEYTATAGQTTFAVTYTAGSIEGVYRNGIKLGTTDYTASSGTDIVLASGAVVGDLICIVSFTNVGVLTAGVNTVSFGSTGLTPGTAASGDIVVSGTLAVASGGTGVTTSTGTGSTVLSNSPTLVTPVLGSATATQLTTGLGSAAAPSITFTGDTNTGIFSPAADTIAFSEGGVEAARFDASGRLLIGTTTSGVATGVMQTISNSSASYTQYNRGTSGGGIVGSEGTGLVYYTYTGSLGSETYALRMSIDASGNVLPGVNGTQNLGSSSLRWANLFTSDLHLNNGIGNYTIVEGEEDLFLYNNKSGKTFKFALIEVDPSTVPAKMKE